MGFTPDNKGVLLISSVEANAARLLQIDLAGGKSTMLAEDKQYDVSNVMIHPEKHTLEAVQFVRARSEWTLIDKSLQADFDAIRKVRDADFNVVSRDLEDKTWIVAYDMDNSPLSFYTFDRTTKQITLLFTNRPALEKSQLARCQPISFKARDGLTIYGYLTLPMGVPSKNLPLVLNVHGGPWGRDSWGLDNEAQWLANRLDFYGRTEEFLAKYLGGRAEPVQKVEDSSAEAR